MAPHIRCRRTVQPSHTLFEADAALAGPRSRHGPNRKVIRHGFDDGIFASSQGQSLGIPEVDATSRRDRFRGSRFRTRRASASSPRARTCPVSRALREDMSPGQDVLRSVAVGIVGATTPNTAEDRLALAAVRCAVATAPALPGGVPRIDEQDSSADGGRLVLEASGEDRPLRPLDRPIEPALATAPLGKKAPGLRRGGRRSRPASDRTAHPAWCRPRSPGRWPPTG